MKKLILALLTLGSLSGFLTTSLMAQTTEGAELMRDIRQANPNATKFEILKLFYEQSMEPADIDRFALAGQASSLHCRENRIRRNNNNIRILYNSLEPSYIVALRANYGPLFSETKLTISHTLPSDDSFWRNRSNVNLYYDNTTMSRTAYDLKASLARIGRSSPVQLYLRQHGELISYRVIYKHSSLNSSVSDLELYGYCWEE